MDESPRSGAGNSMEKLVSELSLGERQNLLDKLKGHSDLSATPLYETDDKEKSQETFEVSYARLPWYYHLYYFFLSIVKSRPPAKVYEDGQIAKLGREITAGSPGFYDYQQNFLLSEFRECVVNLKESARFFYSMFEPNVNHDKGEFYAFLGSLEMGEVHKRLHIETDPNVLYELTPDASGPEIRQQALKIMEEAISSISEEQRNAMYFNARSLHCLKELSAFVFDRVIMAFGSAGQTCPANVVRDLLLNLDNILFSLKDPPTLSLLESLFIFVLQSRTGEKDFDMSREMRKLLGKAENALAEIRNFNKRIPLTRILRCVFRDMSLSPQPISGGEEWYMVYREYWKRQVDGKCSDYVKKRKNNELTNSFKGFLKSTSLKLLENVASDACPSGMPLPEAFTLSFLLTYYSAVFITDINNTLRPILLEGEFFKRENRTEFTESYNDLMKLEDDIKRLEKDLAPNGDLGKRYFQAKKDITSLPVKRRKVQMVLEDASRTATEIIDHTRQAMKSMINVLNGIMKKEAGGKYDSLANLTQLVKKMPLFFDGMNDSIQKFQTALQLLDEMVFINSEQ